jgi:ribosomal protein S18 acetylase RimI-like enzyme
MNMSYTQRFYEGEADYAAMRALIADSYRLSAPHADMMLGDLDWWRALLPEPETFLPRVPLWFAGATLGGFIWPAEGSGDAIVHPAHRAAAPLLLAYAEAHLRKDADGGGQSLMQVSLESDAARNQLLAAQGFVRSDDFLASHVIDLAEPKPQPQLPHGFTIRDMAGPVTDAELEARVNVHRAAFHPSKLTLAKYMAARRAPTYRPELDLVVMTPAGEFGAFTIVWYEPQNRTGLFEPVGCHPDFQRRGLGRAVLYEGLRRLRELGATRAHVNAWLDNSPGALLYRAAGFQLIDRFYEWHKTYPAPNPSQSEEAA